MFNENLLKLVREKNDPSLSRVVDLLSVLHELSKELVPDYPNETHDSFSYLHALTASLTGTTRACDGWIAITKELQLRYNIQDEEIINIHNSYNKGPT